MTAAAEKRARVVVVVVVVEVEVEVKKGDGDDGDDDERRWRCGMGPKFGAEEAALCCDDDVWIREDACAILGSEFRKRERI